jgi:uncharacterized protein (DUF2147 family)
MKHRMFLSTLGLAALAFATTPSHAASDPSGIWLNDVGSAKMEVKKCGKGICAKIVWLKDPNDSKGKPLHDVRNEVASMRDRPILGMPLFGSMVPAGPGVWVGNVYNPEEGHVYTEVKITLASSKTIVLRGCKAWLLCGEKAWTRSKLDTKPERETMPAETPAQIEAKATPAPQAPSAAPEPTPVSAPEPKPQPNPAQEIQASAGGAPEITELPVASIAAKPQALAPEMPQGQDAQAGYGFVTTSATPEHAPPFSSQTPSTMFALTKPAEEPDAAIERGVEAAETGDVPLPAQKPEAKAKPKPQAPVANGTSAPVPTAAKPKPTPKPETTAEADTTVAAAPVTKPKPRVEKKREDLPWLQRP